MRAFPKAQYMILSYLNKTARGGINLSELEEKLRFPSTLIYGDSLTMKEMGYIDIEEIQKREIIWKGFDEEHESLSELPERTVVRVLKNHNGATIPEISSLCGIEAKVIGKTLKILEIKKWAINEKGRIILHPELPQNEPPETEDEKLIKALVEKGSVFEDDLPLIDVEKALELLKPRGKWFSLKNRKERYACLTEEGRKLIKSGIRMRDTVTHLTPALIADNNWREVEFKEYDVRDVSEPIAVGKLHPMTRVVNDVRRIFVEMGFQEIRYSNVESSFWDFDALFQPQDHPAREMQDTFYLNRPKTTGLPEKEIIDKIRKVHENGSDTGSKGWGYKWDIEKSRSAILRTHTTAATIRELYKDPSPPRKVFLVGKVFRRETIDYKHLPFFHQVDGIIIDEDANFQNLLGTLDIFYRKMGFPKFYFRPAFFPYTEPSVEIYVYNPKKKDWMEMGGAGIFRKEVTQPLGCRVPVLAWGLGLERIAMFRYDIEFIKDLYISDIEWLKEVPVCP